MPTAGPIGNPSGPTRIGRVQERFQLLFEFLASPKKFGAS